MKKIFKILGPIILLIIMTLYFYFWYWILFKSGYFFIRPPSLPSMKNVIIPVIMISAIVTIGITIDHIKNIALKISLFVFLIIFLFLIASY